MRSIFFVVCAVLGVTAFSLQFLSMQPELPCANSISCIHNLDSVVENGATGMFLGRPVAVPSIDLANDLPATQVLGDQAEVDKKHIYVDLSSQKLYAYEGEQLFFETLVSTGKWGRTPPGEYQIWVKMRATRMSGGSGNDAYDLPNVPFVLFFANADVPKERGYSLHGAYWHNNFGHEMSHGCVNMRAVDAEVMYHWANPVTVQSTTYESAEDQGTKVSVCNQLQFVSGAQPVCVIDQSLLSEKRFLTSTLLSQTSPDGTMAVHLTSEQQNQGGAGTVLSVQGKDLSEQSILNFATDDKTQVTVPFNTWSPDKEHFFLEQTSDTVKKYLLFQASGAEFDSGIFLDVNDLFAQKNSPYRFHEATGWAAPGLLLVTTRLEDQSPGPSFWFEVASRHFIQLSTQF